MKSVALTLCALLIVLTAHAQQPPQRNIGGVLDAKGAIVTGATGSFTASGYHMSVGRDGAPVFKKTAAVSKGPSLHKGTGTYAFTSYELDFTSETGAEILAVAVAGTEIYFGGRFTTAYGVTVNNIVKWDGSNWTALGTGIDGVVCALAVSGGTLYAGGSFSQAGGTSVNNIAKWQSDTWTALGTGTDDTVYALVCTGDSVYAGGAFEAAGGGRANNVALWTGSGWEGLGSAPGVDGTVYALAYCGGSLYAGGAFTNADESPARHIARWNVAGSSWTSLGDGINGDVYALAASAACVYAGGLFDSAGAYGARNLAQWNGSAWTDWTDPDINDSPDGIVRSILLTNDSLYIGGSFNDIGYSMSVSNCAMWDGSGWNDLGNWGPDDTVFAIAAKAYRVYFTGKALNIGGMYSPLLCMRYNNDWYSMANGISGSVNALAASGGDVYIAGDFNAIGLNPANSIVHWNGTAWDNMNGGVTAGYYILAVAISGTDVYVGGSFTEVGGVAARNIAKWNGSAWSALGGGLDNEVHALVVSGSDLYAGGYFTNADTGAAAVVVNSIAKWNGSAWSALGSGFTGGNVHAIGISGSTLYAGGWSPSEAGDLKSIAMWNGITWLPMGTGGTNVVEAIAVSGSDVYVGGSFVTIGGCSANNIAHWNGSAWSAMGTGASNSVYAVNCFGTDVYIGGYFNQYDIGGSFDRIAKWSGSTWGGLSGGADGTVYALAVDVTRGCMFAGGEFNVIGSTMANGFASFTDAYNPLPVELVSFAAAYESGHVKLTWRTAVETNSLGFEIERRTVGNGAAWQSLGCVAGAGASGGPKDYSYNDVSVAAGRHAYRIKQMDNGGASRYSQSVEVEVGGIPATYALHQNYPNPFNPSTTIVYELPRQEHVRLAVFDLLGREVATLVNGIKDAGWYELQYDAARLASGVYIYRLQAGDFTALRRMVVVK